MKRFHIIKKASPVNYALESSRTLDNGVVLKLIHEAGHGLMVKRFGGQCPELGAMLLVLIPAPYVDASAAWSFSDKWKRIAVGAGGMIFELAVGAAAAEVGAAGEPDVSVGPPLSPPLQPVRINARAIATAAAVFA